MVTSGGVIEIPPPRAGKDGENFVFPVVVVVAGAQREVAFTRTFRSKAFYLMLVGLPEDIVLSSHCGFESVEGREED